MPRLLMSFRRLLLSGVALGQRSAIASAATIPQAAAPESRLNQEGELALPPDHEAAAHGSRFVLAEDETGRPRPGYERSFNAETALPDALARSLRERAGWLVAARCERRNAGVTRCQD